MTRIFLVEDHVMVRDGLRRLLEENQMTLVGEASSGDTAVAAIRRSGAEVVVLDLDLPGRSGLEVLDDLKELPAPPKVIVLTGHAEKGFGVRCIKAGADGFLNKGKGIGSLAEAVRKVHAGGKYMSEDLAEQIAISLAESRPPAAHERLSNREFEVMCRIAKGETLSEIGESLFLSPKTVGTYRRRILDKLELENNAEVSRYALVEGLVQ
ncbi:MAG: response regulator transcription factor [Thermoanaerobaculia bacterium]|nr:response regulator transcription factor [Thermoanaerobaculia bacterium]